MNKTLDYYKDNAIQFFDSTAFLEFSENQDRFLDLLEPGARVLDLGCGSGRDALYFKNHGFVVTAVDGCEDFCEMACRLTGLDVRCLLFEDLDYTNEFDGIWACSSILHLERVALKEVVKKMAVALCDKGVVYTSFKESNFEGLRKGRYFTDMTLEGFQAFNEEIGLFDIIGHWISKDVRPGRGDENWLNLLLRKK